MKEKQESPADLFLHSDRVDASILAKQYLGRPEVDSFGEMCFSMNTGRVVFGVPLYESADSFVVAMPAVLVSDEGRVRGKSLVAEPVVRLYKSNMLFSCRPPELHRYPYYEYLVNNSERMPEFLNEHGIEHLTRLLNNQPKGGVTFHGDEDEGEAADPASTYVLYKNITRH